MIPMHYFLENGLNNQKIVNRLIFVTFSHAFPYTWTTDMLNGRAWNLATITLSLTGL